MAKFGDKAKEEVGRELHLMKEGKLKSDSGQKVTDPKQAITIGLSEARRAGGKVPPAPEGTASAEKEPAKRRGEKVASDATEKAAASGPAK